MRTRDLIEQSGIKASDKVVCIDDSYQRLDLADAPDGLLIRGRVYCVSGVSECGGLVLAGRRAISSRTAKEVGFHPSRFIRLDQFRERFPQGMHSAPGEWDFLDDDAPNVRNTITLPTIAGLEEPKPLVYRVIEVLEAFYAEYHKLESMPPWLESGYWPDQSPEQVRRELQALLRSPQLSAYMNQSCTFWLSLLRKRKPTVLFCRSCSPVANLLFQMCMMGSILSERFLDGDLRESDFPILTAAAGRLRAAPIRICDARAPDTFLSVLFDAQEAFEYALCDWTLAGEEMAAAYRLTCNSQIALLCPQ